MLGRSDKMDFPLFGLMNLRVKIDTGAYTSSIHCHEVEEFEESGAKFIKFKLLDPKHPLYTGDEIVTSDFKMKQVKSSNGIVQKRYVIKSKIIVYNKSYTIDLSLSKRSKMKYPVLLGRKFLSKRFIINTALKNLSFQMTNAG